MVYEVDEAEQAQAATSSEVCPWVYSLEADVLPLFAGHCDSSTVDFSQVGFLSENFGVHHLETVLVIFILMVVRYYHLLNELLVEAILVLVEVVVGCATEPED